MIIVSMWMCAWVLFEVTFIVQQFCTRWNWRIFN